MRISHSLGWYSGNTFLGTDFRLLAGAIHVDGTAADMRAVLGTVFTVHAYDASRETDKHYFGWHIFGQHPETPSPFIVRTRTGGITVARDGSGAALAQFVALSQSANKAFLLKQQPVWDFYFPFSSYFPQYLLVESGLSVSGVSMSATGATNVSSITLMAGWDGGGWDEATRIFTPSAAGVLPARPDDPRSLTIQTINLTNWDASSPVIELILHASDDITLENIFSRQVFPPTPETRLFAYAGGDIALSSAYYLNQFDQLLLQAGGDVSVNGYFSL